ncbi:MAG: transglycosylase SLT domain-containing protein [Caldilineaceae bacterium]
MQDEHDPAPGPEGPTPEPRHEPLHEPLPLEPPPDSLPDPLPKLLPDALRNWQVLEIDGQATTVPEPSPAHQPDGAKARGGQAEDLRDLQIEDRGDDIIVATLDNRRRQVECGSTAVYAVTILNNGDHAALFQVQVEGWLDPNWLGDTTAAAMIEPGTRATLRLPLSPPRRPQSEAGDYHFAVSVRSPQYPARLARVGALLQVLPYDAIDAHFLELPDPEVSWYKRAAIVPLAVANRGNRPVEVELHGASSPQACRFSFAAPGNARGAAAVSLQPNQGISIPVRIEVRRPPLVGLQGCEVGVQVDVRVQGNTPQGGATTARGRTVLLARPLIGPWQFVMVTGLAAAGALGLLLFAALIYLLAQRSAEPPVAAAPPVVAPAAPPVIIVNLNQPASAPLQAGGAAGQVGPSGQRAAASDFTAGASPDPALPLVLPDQVSAPGGAAAAVPAAARVEPGQAAGARSSGQNSGQSSALALNPAPAAAKPGDANQTYGQMFQEVGRRFDLDWRMLAAQAYIESGFDSLALSDAGAMGLMQVLPDTWREWAQPVEVSDPFDAYSNVLVAAAYLDHLRSDLGGKGYPDKQWMLVAYNWGPDKLNSFLQGGGTWDTLPAARRQYATEILRIAKTIP